MLRLLLPMFLLAFLAAAGLPASSQSQEHEALELDQWTSLANRAERVIDAAAASDPALLLLRAELQEWRERALAVRRPLSERVDQLESRLAVLGSEGEEAAGLSAEIDARRADVNEQLAAVRAPLQIADEVAQWANDLIAGIDEILRARRGARLLSAGPSPLLPNSWTGAFEHLAEAVGSVRREVSGSLSSDAGRKALQLRMPAVAALLILGIGLLTVARGWTERLLARHWSSGEREWNVGKTGISQLLTHMVLPAAGVICIGQAIVASDLLDLSVGLANETLPTMALAVFGAHWLSAALFSGQAGSVFPDRLGQSWLSRTRLVIQLAGWVVALQALTDALLSDIDKLAALSGALGFPALVAGAAVLFVLARRLSEHVEARSSDSPNLGIADSALSFLAVASRIAAVVGIVAGAAGFGVGASLLTSAPLLTLALFGSVLVLQAVLADHGSRMLHLVSDSKGRDRSGLVFVLVGIVLFAASIPVLAVIWGATDTDLSDSWALLSEGLHIGGNTYTIYNLLTLIVVFSAGYVGTRIFQSILSRSILPNTDLNYGAQRAIATGTGYVGIILSVVAAVSAAGLNLTNLAIVAGALSVGIGFGLQAVVSNFVSGIILLIERPINEGDWIQAGGVSGTVKRISVRSTLIETFDRAAVVVPNTDLMSGQVVNWTLTDRICRTIVPVGVAYGTDTEKVERILMEIAAEHPAVLDDPPPSVFFMNFGADALEFELRAILNDTNMILRAKSDLNFAIARRFSEEGIQIPFPQRDVWLRNADEISAAVKSSKDSGEDT